jgi:ABC-type glycerol-3-phosphate transport system substrate-binding protein
MKEKRKVMSFGMIALVFLTIFVVLLIGCNGEKKAESGGADTVTLQYMTLSDGTRLDAELQAFDLLKKTNPNIVIETLSVPQVDGFIATLKTKFAAGEAPDFYSFQGGTRVREFAKEGLIMDLTDESFMARANPSDIAFNSYQGRAYGMPISVEYAGLFVNHEKLAEYPGIKVPENFQELQAACKQLQAAGFESPLLLAGKDINNVSQFDFQYLATVAIPANPNYYQELIDGTRKFSDPFIRELFAKFGEVLPFTSEDALGVDNEEAIKRFVRGEGIFWIAHGSTIARIREIAGEEFNFKVYPSVLQDEGEQRYFLCAQVRSVSVSKATKYLDEVRQAITALTSPESAVLMATVGKDMPALLGATALPDSSLEPCQEWFDGPYKVNHADLVWVPGIKDIMKEVTQKWIMGEDLDTILNEWESQHRRLIDSNPDFVANYGKE